MTLTAHQTTSRSTVSQTENRQPRKDIQGLRMVAVTVVFSNHLFGWPAGGFVGVDVFFVISGFLITGLLYREHQRTGRISFAGFYRRRIRRILPISAVVLLVTVAAGFTLYLTSRAQVIAADAAWAFLFSANWHFAAVGTDYWANDGLISPLQHYWSLAVEEQFYIVWPWLLVAVLGFGARHHWSRASSGRRLTFAMLAAASVSFGWALWESRSNPTVAYFSTFSRAWELGVGAALAVVTPTLTKLPRAVRPVLAWLGLIGILASFFVVSELSRIPAPWDALPVLSTAMVIAAGTGGARLFVTPLTNRFSTYIGDISYSLYLWHFPVIVLLAVLLPRGTTYFAVVIGVSFGLSVASYHGIENPVRRSTWLEPGSRATKRRRRRGGARSYARRNRWKLTALSLTAIVSLTLVLLALRPMFLPTDSSGAAPVVAPSTTSASAARRGLAPALGVDIQAALAAKRFPRFVPSINSLGIEKWAQEVGKGGCFNVDAKNAAACESGSGAAHKDVVVLGDSYAVAWMPGIRKVFDSLGWRLHVLTLGECPSISVTVTRSGGIAFPECDEHRSWAMVQIAQLKPDLVILADSNSTTMRLASQAQSPAADQQITQGMVTTLAKITPHAKRVVVLSPPPAGKNLQDCVTRVSVPPNCVRTIEPGWWSFDKDLKAAATSGHAVFVETRSWFCSPLGACPGFVGAMPVRADGSHLTVAYSESLAPVLAESILG